MLPLVSRVSVASLFVLSALAFALRAEVPEVQPNPRQVIPLDASWRFHLGDDAGAREPKFDDSAWRVLDVPHDWTIELPINPPPAGEPDGGFFAHGIGWYRKIFPLPASASNQQIVIEFDGVYMNSDVWVNGHFLGRRPYGFIGFRYDLTAFLHHDGTPNVIAVRVDDSAEPSVRWYAGAGIYRHVRLIATAFTHFRHDGGIRITTPAVAAEQATVETEATIEANFFTDDERQAWAKDNWHVKPVERPVIFRSTVLGSDDRIVATAESTVVLKSMQHNQHATQRLTVPQPQLWSDRHPTLYRLRNTLELDGKVLDEVTTTFGIRRLEFDPDRGLFVNGEPTKLKGVCVHQDAASFGNAVPMEIWAWRLAQLKEMGCNAIRPSHHPFAPEFYDLCDQLGFYVFDEAFDEWTRDWPYNLTEDPRGKSMYGYHLYFQQWHETDLRAMLRRDRNHPCVVLYSIGNEIPNQLDDDGWKMAKELVGICHEEDATRPVTSACDQSYVASRNGFMDTLDIGGYNYIDRLYGERTYAPEHVRFPHRLFLGTETTARLHNWLGVRDHDYVIGDFIWTGVDYLGESHQFPHRGSGSGFLDLAGGRKPGFFQRAAYWREEPVLQLSVLTGEKADGPWRGPPAYLKWNWKDGAALTVRAATNCDEVELFLNGHSLGRHLVSPDQYVTEWPVAFASGTLSATAYRAGKQVATNELRTVGAPARLQLTPLHVPIAGDIALYEITVVDAAGLTDTDATSAVSVRVNGPAQLIGLDTGDLDYGGLFKTNTRNAYHGRLLAAIRRTSRSGEFHVIASAPNLTAGTIGSSASASN